MISCPRVPDLRTIETPGPLTFLQAVAIDGETVEKMKRDEIDGRGHETLEQVMESGARISKPHVR